MIPDALAALPPVVLLGTCALSVFGAAAMLELPAGRTAFLVLSHVTFALFLVVGPPALFVPLVSSAPVLVAYAVYVPLRARLRPLSVSLVGLVIGVTVASLVTRLLGGAYPLPLASIADVVRSVGVLVLAYVVFTTTKEALTRLTGHAIATDPLDVLEQGVSIYAFGALLAGPILVLSLAVFHLGGPGPWLVVVSLVLAAQAAIPVEVRRVQRLRALLAVRAARERTDALGEVTTRVAHQMRHQLGLIGLSLHRIEQDLAAHGMQELGIVREELANLSRAQDELRAVLASDLATASRLESVPDWGAVIRGPLARLEWLARERGVTLDAATDALPDGAPRSGSKLEQAWFNVVENAIAAARSRVTIEVERREDSLVLAVTDDGPGMTDAVLAHATDPFFTTKPDGTGVGLAIARAVAEELGGRLRFERPEVGLRVVFELPWVNGSSEEPNR